MVAYGQPIYLGVFHGGLSNYNWPVPYIEDSENCLMYPPDVIHISWIWLLHADEDKRNLPTVRQSLEALNLCRPGIAVSLDHIDILQNSDTTTISYTVTLTNYDTDPLYIPDPELMGTDLFHYYNNGPTLVDVNNGSAIGSDLKTTAHPDSLGYWNPDWFVRLPSAQSIHRVILLRGYPRIPPGTYTCDFRYCGPRNIQQDRRYQIDGRYWIGPTTAKILTITTS